MRDTRFTKLADLLTGYSVSVEQGENVLIEVSLIPPEMTDELIEAVRRRGGVPFLEVRDARVQRSLVTGATEQQMLLQGEFEMARMKKMQCYIGLRGQDNSSEMSGIPQEDMSIYLEHVVHPVHFEQRVRHTKWVVLRWPTPAMAQSAQMSTQAFEDFYFDVCTMNYAKMAGAAESLKMAMDATSRVRLIGPGETDLSFSIEGIPGIVCAGDRNIPDGEVFTAPVRDSVNGVIAFNAPTIYQGQAFDGVRLEFKDGKCVDASCSDTDGINKLLDTDEGARYVGEFSVAFNPYITRPMRDILFDEKIAGSIHFTPGQAYEEADNGNRSKVHWDMVLIQTAEHGGGEMYFDDQLVRKDGLFVSPDLEPLNPENLKNS